MLYLVAALPVPVGADGGVVQVLEGEGDAVQGSSRAQGSAIRQFLVPLPRPEVLG